MVAVAGGSARLFVSLPCVACACGIIITWCFCLCPKKDRFFFLLGTRTRMRYWLHHSRVSFRFYIEYMLQTAILIICISEVIKYTASHQLSIPIHTIVKVAAALACTARPHTQTKPHPLGGIAGDLLLNSACTTFYNVHRNGHCRRHGNKSLRW